MSQIITAVADTAMYSPSGLMAECLLLLTYMAIIRSDQSNDDMLHLEVNNGDLQALKAIKDKLNLTSEEAVLRFALAVLSQSSKDAVYIEDATVAKVGLQPSDSLRSHDPHDTTATER